MEDMYKAILLKCEPVLIAQFGLSYDTSSNVK